MTTNLTKEISNSLKLLDFNKRESPNIDNGERAISLATGVYLLYQSLKSVRKHPLMAIQGSALGGLMIYRGTTGVCPVYKSLGKDTTDPQAISITEQITVNVSRERVYNFWRQLSNLPKFMKHLKRVIDIGSNQSHWIANTPGNLIDLSWNAEITREEEGKYIGWQSIENSMIVNAGKIEFKDTLNGTGTELIIEINYFPPAGSVGRGLATVFNGVFEKIIREDIQNFKTYAEKADFMLFAGLES